VTEIAVLGCVGDRSGTLQARLEPLDPARTARRDRGADEILACERQHDVQFGAARKQRLGKEDVRAARQRAVAEADPMLRELLGDCCRNLRLLLGLQAPGAPW